MAIATGISVEPAVGKEAMRRRPPRRPAIADSAASAVSRRARMPSACPTSVCPAAVRLTPRGWRSSSVMPVSASSAAICWETADWV